MYKKQGKTRKTNYTSLNVFSSLLYAYVAVVENPLNYHLHIYWPSPDVEKHYLPAKHYDYKYISEEDKNYVTRRLYSCHLRGIEIHPDKKNDRYSNSKEAYIYMNSQILHSNGWVLVSVGDIDVYGRILVEIYDIFGETNYNKMLLTLRNHNNEPIAKVYEKPTKT